MHIRESYGIYGKQFVYAVTSCLCLYHTPYTIHYIPCIHLPHHYHDTHTNISFCCFFSWHPNNELLVTVSRDGAAKVWQLTYINQAYNLTCIHTITTPHTTPLTSVCIHQTPVHTHTSEGGEGSVVLVGGEDGFVYVYVLHAHNTLYDMRYTYTLPSEYAHTKTVKKIKCRPGAGKEGVEFVTCGDDHTVRIHKLYF
ncbi:hypothetical protein EON63_20850 [archaeon]|nr:MAG: hypothetical protein EON63_20850 [archaeon]